MSKGRLGHFRAGVIAACAVLSLGVAVTAFAQEKAAEAMAKLNVVLPRAEEEKLALSGSPEHLRAAATLYIFGKNGFEKARTGTNGFTCLLNRDAFFYGVPQFKPTCWDRVGATTYLPVMLKTGEMLAHGQSFEAIKAAIDAGFANSTFRAPDAGGVAYMLAGDNSTLPSVTGAGAGADHGLTYIIAVPGGGHQHAPAAP